MNNGEEAFEGLELDLPGSLDLPSLSSLMTMPHTLDPDNGLETRGAGAGGGGHGGGHDALLPDLNALDISSILLPDDYTTPPRPSVKGPSRLAPDLLAPTPRASAPSTPRPRPPLSMPHSPSFPNLHPPSFGRPSDNPFASALGGSGPHVAAAAAARLSSELNLDASPRFPVRGLDSMMAPSPFASPPPRPHLASSRFRSLPSTATLSATAGGSSSVAGSSGLSSLLTGSTSDLGAIHVDVSDPLAAHPSTMAVLDSIAHYPEQVRAGLARKGGSANVIRHRSGKSSAPHPHPILAKQQAAAAASAAGSGLSPKAKRALADGLPKPVTAAAASSKKSRASRSRASSKSKSKRKRDAESGPSASASNKRKASLVTAAPSSKARRRTLPSANTFVPPPASNKRVYEIEILGTKLVNGVCFHLVHFIGFPSKYDTWQPSSDIRVLDINMTITV